MKLKYVNIAGSLSRAIDEWKKQRKTRKPKGKRGKARKP